MNTARPMMDRRLKERLVGATILVAVIVLVVPELLSGPKHPALPPLAAGLPTTATRSVSVDLSTNRATAEPEAGVASQAASAGSPNAAPDAGATGTPGTNGASNASGASSATSAAAPSTDAGEPAAASAPSVVTLKAQTGALPPLETPASPPKSSATTTRPAGAAEASAAPRRAWAVQLGSFASKANAERLVHRLQASGGSFYVAPGGSGSALRYRVRMGPLADRGAAERALAKLKAQGHSATIVTPAS
jgi:DedD protein